MLEEREVTEPCGRKFGGENKERTNPVMMALGNVTTLTLCSLVCCLLIRF